MTDNTNLTWTAFILTVIYGICACAILAQGFSTPVDQLPELLPSSGGVEIPTLFGYVQKLITTPFSWLLVIMYLLPPLGIALKTKSPERKPIPNTLPLGGYILTGTVMPAFVAAIASTVLPGLGLSALLDGFVSHTIVMCYASLLAVILMITPLVYDIICNIRQYKSEKEE